MAAKKITLRNFKKFIGQHFGNAKSPLLISVQSKFDGMVDCVMRAIAAKNNPKK